MGNWGPLKFPSAWATPEEVLAGNKESQKIAIKINRNLLIWPEGKKKCEHCNNRSQIPLPFGNWPA